LKIEHRHDDYMSKLHMRSSNGEYYGYKKCCIKAFHRVLLTDTKWGELSNERKTTTTNGFVPCQTCAELILQGKIKIEDCILPTRQCPTPFKRV
jgi:hypothetical protein